MDITAITPHVRYIGVNDRTTALFEGLWPLPLGVSYNSYLVTGAGKVAVIDGVQQARADEQIGNIKAILGDRRPDYLVINHMEPDHSGGLKALRAHWPDITVVGNAITLGMVKGYYGTGARTLAVKDGDSLDLGGGCTLSFHLTPMVHWPETMMTLLDQEHVLFSGDAFGCFGALRGAVADTDMDTSVYWREMERYYSNIVGKYGQFVQRALRKLHALEVHTLCPTHGPVWRQELPGVMALYDRLSRYEPLDEGVAVIYGSMYGHTARAAEAAARALAGAGVREIEVFDASATPLSYLITAAFRHRGLLLASPTYSDGVFPPVAALIQALATRGLVNRRIALIGSYTWADRATAAMAEMLRQGGLADNPPAVSFKQAPTDADLASVAHMVDFMCAR